MYYKVLQKERILAVMPIGARAELAAFGRVAINEGALPVSAKTKSLILLDDGTYLPSEASAACIKARLDRSFYLTKVCTTPVNFREAYFLT